MSNQTYTSMYSRNAELYHHGIKGQKWGVRNGPPYPLGSGKSPSKFIADRREKGIAEDWADLDSKVKVGSIMSTAFITTGVASGMKRSRDKMSAEEQELLHSKSSSDRAKAIKTISQKEAQALSEKSNQELEQEIRRLRLEAEYKRLTASQPSPAKDYAVKTAKKTINAVTDASIKMAVDKLLPKVTNKVTKTVVKKYNKLKNAKESNDEMGNIVKFPIKGNKNPVKGINEKKRAAIQKDIDSFKPFLKTGIKDKSGRLMLSPEDVQKSIAALEKKKQKV